MKARSMTQAGRRKMVLLLTGALVALGALSAQAQEEEPPSPCTTKTVSLATSHTHNGSETDKPEQSMQMTVANLCDGTRLYVEIVAQTDALEFLCELLTLRQPRDLSQPQEAPAWLPDEYDDTEDYLYYYGGHGYHHDEPSHFNNYVTVHHPGNTTGICHHAPLRKGQTRRFWISVDPERVDNPEPLSFLKPFRLYYEAQLLLAFP